MYGSAALRWCLHVLAQGCAAAANPTGPPRSETTMGRPLDHICETLALSENQKQELIKDLSANPDTNVFCRESDAEEYPASGSAAAACAVARKALGSSVVDTSPLNDTVVHENWSQTCWANPRCIITPKSTQQVAQTIQIISQFKAPFSIRSGGHSPNPGFSSIPSNGILVDLSQLNQFKVSPDHSAVSLGPGMRWGDVIAALDPYGVSVVGGRIPHVGVGGLVLGGGLFHFSGEYGLTADNVNNFEVVLADGKVTNANAQQNSDLFWALKGGGPNFGIVTRYDMATIPVHNIWYQVSIYSNDQVDKILRAFAAWQNNGGASDLKSTVALVVGLESTTIGLIYSQPSTTVPAAFAPFENIPAMQQAVPATNGTVLSLTTILGSIFSNAPARHDYRGASSKIDAELYVDVYNVWKQKAEAVHHKTGANMTFTIQPIPANLAAVGEKNGGNPMGIPKINHQWWTTLVDWTNASDDDMVRSAPIATTDAWDKLSQQRNLGISYRYMNDCSREQNPLISYGKENLEKLRQIAKKYDPDQVFQKLQNNGFLVSKA